MRWNVFKAVLFTFLMGAVFIGGWAVGIRSLSKHSVFHSNLLYPYLTKDQIQAKISKLNDPEVYQFKKNEVELDGFKEPVVLEYGFDPSLQSTAEDLLARFKPDLGAIVAMDASTGRILAMSSMNRVFEEFKGNPAFEQLYPSASVFKVVTAAAAIENQKMTSNSVMEYAGRNHTLYKYQVLKERVTGWKTKSTLKEAFARSINTVFGRVGVFALGKGPLKSFSNRFAFNEPIPSEFPIAESQSADPSSEYELAEMASGFTQHNVMSAVHGAMIAAAVANEGVMMEPYFLNAAYTKSGKPIYHSEPMTFKTVMTPETAQEVQKLMQETVASGTSRKSFHGFFKGKFSELEVGGKTGHLTDKTSGGRIDWFVGFAQAYGRKLAVSVITMHQKYWTVKSSYLARRTFESAFAPKTHASNRHN
ncbi:MAG: penicillin-binding protein [Bdellovibrionales bacterium]|nr:penicillin-binding protein [Bdellovibrionales bacterium]